LDKNAFLQLLITQLRYQDPLNPMDDRDFMAQMAQFSALEQMMNLNNTFERSQALSMIGRTVEGSFLHPNTGEWIEIHGMVQAVTTSGSETFLFVDGYDVPISAVHLVAEDFITAHQLDAIFEHVHHARFQDLVGRYVQALLVNSDGDVTEFVEGQVDHVKFAGAQAILVIGNREVFPREVTTVGNGPMLLGATYFTHGNAITNVDIRNGRAYLIFDNDVRVHITRINYAMEVLQYVGQEITHGSITGTVESITIRGGAPFFNVRDDEGELREINYLLYLADRIGSSE